MDGINKKSELMTNSLHVAMKEAADYQRPFALRDKDNARRFGQHPTVGIFDSRSASACS
jgi:hypothetical protein